MTVTDEQRKAIEDEFAAWQADQYAGKTKEERQKFSQFFTPPQLSIKMIEKFDSLTDKDILDPTSGAGGLIAAAIFAGASPSRVYGIELDPVIASIARVRLAKLGVPRHHIHLGNALVNESYDFPESSRTFKVSYDKTNKTLSISISRRSGELLAEKTMSAVDRTGITAFHTIAKRLIDAEIECISGENIITKLGLVFKRHGLSEL